MFLNKTGQTEYENMEFVYQRNEDTNGCFLSRNKDAVLCSTEEMELNDPCCSFDPPSPPFDLAGRWVDTKAQNQCGHKKLDDVSSEENCENNFEATDKGKHLLCSSD